MKSTLSGSALILLSILAYIFAIRAYKLVVPEHVDRDTINITREQYEQALDKWLSQGVVEYEIRVSREDEIVTLRVIEAQDTVYLLEQITDGEQVPVPGMASPLSIEGFWERTVEGLFATVEDRLDRIESGEQPRPSEEQHTYFYDYEVGFDPNLGYPTHIRDRFRIIKQPREIIWRVSIRPPTEVKSFKVIRR